MKKTKWMFILLLSTVMILATMQSVQAMGKSAVTLFGDIVQKDAPGTKYYGTLTIYYVGIQDESKCTITTDAPTQMLFFVTLRKGNKLFWFSWKSPSILCLIEDEQAQQDQLLLFAAALMKSLYPDVAPLPIYAVKSIDEFVDATATDPDVVVGQDHNVQQTDLGFMMMNFCLAVQE